MDSQPEVKSPELPKEVTLEHAMKIAENVWWRRELYSPAGLTHLFPGLGSKKK